MIDFNNPAQVQYLKNKCLSDFIFYVQFFFKIRKGFNFVLNWHHIEIAKKLVSVYLGETKRLIINMPPQTGKTELVVVMFISWCIAQNPMCRFIHISASGDLVLENSYNTREIINLGEYQALFDVRLKVDSKATFKWFTNHGGGLYAVSSGGQIAGFPAGVLGLEGFNGALIIDDPLKPDDKYSKVRKEAANRRVEQTINSRLARPSETPVIVVMQRLVEDDTTGFLLEVMKSEGWEILKIPAMIGDESFFPWKYSREKLLQIKLSNKWYFFSEFQQEPAPTEGGIYDKKYWKYYKILPQIEHMCIIADTAQKTGENNDYTVFQCWGYAERKIYLIDQVREKLEAPELTVTAKAFFNKFLDSKIPGLENAKVRAFYVEDKVSGTGLIQELRRSGGIPIKPIPRHKDKMVRAKDAAGQIEAGNVLLPQEAPFLSDYLQEHALFPNGEFDDQVDGTNDAIAKMLNTKETRIWV